MGRRASRWRPQWRVERERRGGVWRLGLVLAALGVAAGLVLHGGARAERTAATSAPSLDSLLEQRESFDRPPPTAPAVDQLRSRHGALRLQRADIEGSLPPVLRTPRSRRPELRRPPLDLPGRESAVAIDSRRDNPDRVAFEVTR